VDKQAGFSLPSLLLAALFFSVSLLGLLQYHQVLLQAFQRQAQLHQAWQLAHQQLEIHAAGGHQPLSLPVGWQLQQQTDRVQPACERLSVRVITRDQQQAYLQRWYCRSAENDF